MQKKLFGFWGLRPQALTGALPVDPTGGLPFPRPLLPPFLFFLDPPFCVSCLVVDRSMMKQRQKTC